VLFTKSPGGVLATAARVSAFRAQIERAAAGSGIDPDLLEGIVFLESAGRPDAIAGPDPDAAAGLTQILAGTGQDLLGLHIDLAASRRLTRRIIAAQVSGHAALAARLARRRAGVDQRFDPAHALAATVRYLELARARLQRTDLAVVSYHMGIGNLQDVLARYDGGRPVPYVQLYFDTAPDHHRAAYTLLSGLGDDSSLYYWRVLGAMQIMRLYRSDRPALERLNRLQLGAGSGALVLHPPDRTPGFADPSALWSAYAAGTLTPLPSNPTQLGLSYNPAMGWLAGRLGAPARLYRGLRPDALALVLELAARVRALSGGAAPLVLWSTVLDARYQSLLGAAYPGAVTGYSFELERRYVNDAQAGALQAMLDRLQALNLIAWSRNPTTLDVTVASGAAAAIARGLPR
jgi:hypothetical protein